MQLVCVVRARKRAERAGCFERLGVVRVQIVDEVSVFRATATGRYRSLNVGTTVNQQEPEPRITAHGPAGERAERTGRCVRVACMCSLQSDECWVDEVSVLRGRYRT